MAGILNRIFCRRRCIRLGSYLNILLCNSAARNDRMCPDSRTYRNFFTARCTTVQSEVCRPSVRPSVCLSVTLVDQEHIVWKAWKLIIAWTISPTPSLFVAERPSTYSQGNMRKYGETRGGVGKSGVLEPGAASD